MESRPEAQSTTSSAEALAPPKVSEDGRLVAGFYEVEQSGPKRIGFAVIDSADHLRPESLPAVPVGDDAAVARLREAARTYLSGGKWRSMAAPDRAHFQSGRDAFLWNDLGLSVTVSEEGSLWFSQTGSGRVLGDTPSASSLIEKRGCAFRLLYHNLLFNDVAGFDPQTRLAFLAFDVVEGNRDATGFAPFKCDPSVLVHVVRVERP